MKALSFKQPWAWAIFNGKPVDNRSRRTNYRGPLLIHASQTFDEQGFFWLAARQNKLGIELPFFSTDYPTGILGQANLIDCVMYHPSPWFFGPYGYVLDDSLKFDEPIAYPGKPWIFEVPDSLVQNIQSSIGNRK